MEAARGLQIQGCDVTIVHLLDTLMERQLDFTAGSYLKRKMERLGIRVLLSRGTSAILGHDCVEAIQFADGERIAADLVVIAAGIRPNVDLARRAGLKVNRGIVVDDYMETSQPNIFAVGECVEHRGVCYGLIAPLIEQGKVLAAAITGNRGLTFEGAAPASKLKIMGVDVFSAGDLAENSPASAAETEIVHYEDAVSRYLQKAAAHGR